MTKKLLLVDHLALLHRSRSALLRTGRKFTTSEGIPTTGVHAYLQCLLSIIKEQEPTHVLVAFDAGSNKRKEENPEYKANRKPLDPDFLCENRILLNEALYALGIESVGIKNYEADDLIATYAHVAQFGVDRFDEIVVATVDQDLLQIVTEKTKVLLANSAKKQILMGVDEVLEKWSCFPDQITLIKALSGDASDNIKGVKGVGKKTALKICNECKWLLGDILSHPKVREYGDKVKDNLELIHLRNCTGVIGPIRWDDYVIGLGMRKDWEEFLSTYELNSLAKRVGKTTEMMKLRG
jgi:5'-3' exonuclease